MEGFLKKLDTDDQDIDDAKTGQLRENTVEWTLHKNLNLQKRNRKKGKTMEQLARKQEEEKIEEKLILAIIKRVGAMPKTNHLSIENCSKIP
uniref:Uncharacterized protein n=1 Tax=Romanomermis culicivorax TaxID=13658 RepID=A0A915JSM5_ROMCU